MNIADITHDLYRYGVFKIGQFTLKSGAVSPFYLDLRIIPSHPSLFKKVITIYESLLKQLEYTPAAIAGIMSAGVPFATGLCLQTDLPLLQIRANVKDHGMKKMIEGTLPPAHSKVVLLDDLVSTGASKLPVIAEVRKAGLEVEEILVLVDRSETKAYSDLSDAGVKIVAAGTIDDLFTGLRRSDISSTELQVIEDAFVQWQQT